MWYIISLWCSVVHQRMNCCRLHNWKTLVGSVKALVPCFFSNTNDISGSATVCAITREIFPSHSLQAATASCKLTRLVLLRVICVSLAFADTPRVMCYRQSSIFLCYDSVTARVWKRTETCLSLLHTAVGAKDCNMNFEMFSLKYDLFWMHKRAGGGQPLFWYCNWRTACCTLCETSRLNGCEVQPAERVSFAGEKA